MTILFMDGFEGTEASSILDNLRRNFLVSVVGDEPLLRPGSSVGNAVSFGDTGNAVNTKILYSTDDLLGQTIIVGFRFKTRDHTSGTTEHFILEIVRALNERHLSVSINYSDGSILIHRGNTLLATSSTGLIGLDTWYHLEFMCNIHDSTGLYELKLDGTTILDDSGIDTKEIYPEVLGIQFNGIQALNNNLAAEEFLIDDFYLLTGTTFLGPDTRVRTVYPIADGVVNDFTPQTGVDNFAMVDEDEADDADYNDGVTNGDIDEYQFGPIIGDVNGLMLRTHAVSGLRTFRHRVRSGASIGNGADNVIVDDVDINTIFETDPDTSSPWVTSDVNAAEFGVEVRD